ncbi:MAG TPA: His/Gly/Thr/Pro-type tRNA ligase C-terminal domain-containing protein, partial [Candidatus Dojkabacteria bacterium]|nr:His/Gly/Thr/Pro-type tRNA ligase C-terminal domain-containing protein [Candidatus Dojkabacteria bacterium]
KFSGQDLSYRDPQTNEKFTPWIVETSGGVDRTFLFLLFDSYEEELLENGETRTVLKINPKISAYKAAIFPLVANKPEITGKAREIFEKLVESHRVVWDDRGNIGKRYRYQDEIGTPYCITVDYQTLEDNTVTIRDRDNMTQIRLNIEEIDKYLTEKLK